ncbi:hypothetical protein RB594_002220 [Gaeumannomyces avenae]
MISVTPHNILLQTARELDEERARGNVGGPLHGIPITVKDNIMTEKDLGLPTTVGSLALKGAFASRNAPVVDSLVRAGVIIIGKANLSEMTGYKGFKITTGWSALGGQTQSPYVVGGFKDDEKLFGHSAPAGSSSGSTAGLAAGFAALALATETDGSIVQPANRAALYGIKATVGSIPTEGTAPWSPVTDSIGGMAKSPEDLANLMDVLLGNATLGSELGKFAAQETWEGLKVAFVDPSLWSFLPIICDPDPVLIEQQRTELDAAVSLIESSGAAVKRNVPLTSMDELEVDGEDAMEMIWGHDFVKEWSGYLKGYQDCDIKSVEDIIKFNKKNAQQALPPRYPDQQLLEMAVNDKLPDEKYNEAIKVVKEAARHGVSGIDKILAEHDLDVILGPMDGRIPTIAAAAGYPVGTMPLGYSKTNGRAFGACIISGAGQEAKILKAMGAWDVTVGKRRAPPQLVDESKPSL